MYKLSILYGLLACSTFIGMASAIYTQFTGIEAALWATSFLIKTSELSILSNGLVFTLCISQLAQPTSKIAYWFTNVTVQTSITTYITISALAFQLTHSNANLQGISLVSSILLHYVTPLLFLFYWFNEVRGKVMLFKRTLWVLSLPALYLVYWLLWGTLTGYQPHPLGYSIQGYSLVLAMALTGLACWCVSVMYWAISKFMVPLYV